MPLTRNMFSFERVKMISNMNPCEFIKIKIKILQISVSWKVVLVRSGDEIYISRTRASVLHKVQISVDSLGNYPFKMTYLKTLFGLIYIYNFCPS